MAKFEAGMKAHIQGHDYTEVYNVLERKDDIIKVSYTYSKNGVSAESIDEYHVEYDEETGLEYFSYREYKGVRFLVYANQFTRGNENA